MAKHSHLPKYNGLLNPLLKAHYAQTTVNSRHDPFYKVGLDGHDRGIKVVATLLKEAGMEVVYLGMYQTPEGIVRAALDEDVNVIGVSYLSGEHLVFTPKIVAEMKKNEMDDVLLIAGGTFPAEDIPTMEAMGIDKVFRAGSLTDTIVSYIHDHVWR